DGLQWLSGEFSLCSPLKKTDLDGFKAWLQETWVNLAMVDYPYEANFLQPLPRWPIQVVCKHLGFDPSSVSDYQLLGGVSEAACTEMVMPLCTDGVQDMFEPQDWNFQAFSDECHALFGVRPRADWADTVYGGLDIASHSNIIFSNGGLDPWSSGGVTRNISDSVVAIVIPDGAHHLDLRYNNEYDPHSVLSARSLEVEYFKLWITQARKSNA
ncbi:unnamed protein product, partial [Coregonus sp. 'balchen']